MQQVFISYKSEEDAEMQKLLKIIEDAGISCWVAPRNIPIGSNYAAEIPAAIDSCPIFILMLSKKAQVSPWIAKELSLAIGANKAILPIMIEDCTLTNEYKYYLTNVQIYSITRDAQKTINELLERIGFLLHTKIIINNKADEQIHITEQKQNMSEDKDKDSDFTYTSGIRLYDGNKPYIFISYAHRDMDKTLSIARGLSDCGYRIWLDMGIEAGSEWPERIAEKLDECDIFIPLISDSYQNSRGCKNELQFAIMKNKKILTVMLDDKPLSDTLSFLLSGRQTLAYYRHKSAKDFTELLTKMPILNNYI